MSTRQHRTCPIVLLLIVAMVGCAERRVGNEAQVTYQELAPVLARKCQRCHGRATRPGAFSTESYLSVIACTDDGRPVALPQDESAPIVAVLARPDHAALLDAHERELLVAWLRKGAPAYEGGVHPADIIDPRSDDWHGKLAARDHWAALSDPNAPFACGRCHDGSPMRPANVRFAAPNAPDCRTCHTEERGVLACSTCHGQGEQSAPPRDPCFFAGSSDAHAAHVEGTRFRLEPLTCETCHPVPSEQIFAKTHADGKLDVSFDAALAGADASFDPQLRNCTVACHARAGTQPTPSFRERSELDCQSCHRSPPESHYPGPCGSCHAEALGPDQLAKGRLHLNGRVDLGAGDTSCGACHGQPEDPWPLDASHRAHRDARTTQPIGCDNCHAVPERVVQAGHLDGVARVALRERATGPGLEPRFDAASGRCSEVACHGAALKEPPEPPRWGASPSIDPCTTCHGAPPPPPHVQLAGCGGTLCHGDEVGPEGARYRISEPGRARHIDGTLQAGEI